MNQTELKAAIIAKHNEVVAYARQRFPSYAHAPAPAVYFYDTGKAAGLAHGNNRVGYNLTVFAHDPQRFINDTVPHEIAHIVCFYLGVDKGHGKNWKAVCGYLGGSANRCYSSEGIEHKMMHNRKQYQYRATCGTVIMVSDVMHNKIQRGQERRLIKSNGILNSSGYTGVYK